MHIKIFIDCERWCTCISIRCTIFSAATNHSHVLHYRAIKHILKMA